MDENCTISTSVFRYLLVRHCRRSRHWSIFFLRSLDWASLRKLSAKRTASINGRRALACWHEHVDATQRCTTSLSSLFNTSDGWDFWRKVDLASPHYILWGFVKERVMSVVPTAPDDIKERIRRACTEITPQMLAEVRWSFHQRINKCLQVEVHHFEHLL